MDERTAILEALVLLRATLVAVDDVFLVMEAALFRVAAGTEPMAPVDAVKVYCQLRAAHQVVSRVRQDVDARQLPAVPDRVM